MKQALKVIEEIKADRIAINGSKNHYLCKDKQKHITRLKKELEQYCYYKKIDYYRLVKQHNI